MACALQELCQTSAAVQNNNTQCTLSGRKIASSGAVGKRQLIWDELQCSADAFNNLLSALTVPATPDLTCYEVLAIEDWFIATIPGSVSACIVAVPDGSVPVGDAFRSRPQSGRNSSEAQQADMGSTSEAQPAETTKWHMSQLVGNACGTIALMHCLMNLPDCFFPSTAASATGSGGDAGSILQQWRRRPTASSRTRGEWLEEDAAIAQVHASAADWGSVSQTSLSSEPNGHHFIAYLPGEGTCLGDALGQPCTCFVWELDGDLPTPLSLPCACMATGGGGFLNACVQLASARTGPWDDSTANGSIAMLAVCSSPP